MSTTYLKFSSQQEALDSLAAAGFALSEYNDMATGDGWGPVFPAPNGVDWLANIYDGAAIHEALQPFVTPAPLTTYNVRAGDYIETVFRTVIVTAAIRDTARAMVVAMAGDTHADMWSQGLSADGIAPATHYINSGPVRTELAAMLGNADMLAAGTGITLAEAQYILSQCIVSDDEPHSAIAAAGLQMITAE